MPDTGFQDLTDGAEARLFVLSFNHREAVAKMADSIGWRAIAARRADDIVNRWRASGASIAVVDARGDGDAGAAALEALGDAVEAVRGALVVAGDADAIDRLIDAGATHSLTPDFGTEDLDRALRLAQRHVDRLRGPVSDAAARSPIDHALTGSESDLAARALIEEYLATPKLGAIGVLLVGVTRFEMINTAFGRRTGDALLQSVARRIEPLVAQALGEAGFVARMAGAEFVVASGGFDDLERHDLAQAIIDRIERPFLADGHMVSLGCRVGLVESVEGDDATTVLRRAAGALAQARSSDGPAIHSLSAIDEGAVLFDAGLETDLRRALDNDEIEILFQPQVSVTSGDIIGVEALARWMHPVHGELGAVTLFAVAERSDYLNALSVHVQRRAVSIASGWPDALGGLRLSVNLTASDIGHPGFVANFLAMVDASGFPRERLTVEVTENGLIEDLAGAAEVLAELRAGGCRVAIDDFGTGYSSLAYLKALPLDYLKIDKHLAQDIAGSTRDRIVVRGVIDMARSLGLSVIAEGVETDEQLALLAAEGCQFYQGFLCAEPLATDALIELVGRPA